ncbi:hypothetical protein [Paenibacillus rigui]|uniref:Uncharacterized protein n=1 Tax=Paenibacillus rigui TaxID=554312 RepID=A0A229UH57_9BACL|nr:hypothetical protein [Paenibacillus rigui]OXM82289.1 hypothetical protein CF651_31735 [Paenibacillus rigui]
MKKDGEYILFLFKDPQNDRYGIVAINQGKYSTNGSVDIYEDNKENPEYKRIEKFTNMVVNKYLKQPEPQPQPQPQPEQQQPQNTDSVTDSVYKKNTESVTNSVYDKK